MRNVIKSHIVQSAAGSGAGGGSGWVPTELAGLALWLPVMSDPDSVTAAGGTATALADASSNGRDYGGSAPYGSRTINGVTVLDFSNHGFTPNLGWSLAQPFTFACVVHLDTIDAFNAIVSPQSGSIRRWGTGTTDAGVYQFMNGSTLSVGGTTGLKVFVGIANGASSSIRINGSQVVAGNSGLDTFASNHGIGREAGSGLYPLNGGLGDLVISSGALSGDDLTNLESFLLALAGL